MFFKYEKECIEKLSNYLHQNDEVYACEIDKFEDVKKMIKETGQEYNIRAVGTILARLCDIALCRYENTDLDHKYLADVMKSTLLTNEQAEKIENLLKNKKEDESQIDFLIRKLEEK